MSFLAVTVEHDLNAYIQMLSVDGNLAMVDASDTPLPVGMFGRERISGPVHSSAALRKLRKCSTSAANIKSRRMLRFPDPDN